MVNPDAHLVEPLGRQLVFTAKAMREAFEDALTAAGGSLGTWIVLSALSDVGCMSQAALASHVHLEGATITHQIDRLEAAGLVRQQPVLGWNTHYRPYPLMVVVVVLLVAETALVTTTWNPATF